MRFSLIVLLLSTLHAHAENQVLTGTITKVNPRFSTTTLKPSYCRNAPGENWHCTALELQDVVIRDSSGQETTLKKLLLPGKIAGGLMGMGMSFEPIALAMALAPKEQWAGSGFEGTFESAEIASLNFITVPANQLTEMDSTSAPIGLGQIAIRLKFKESMLKEMNAWTENSTDPTARPPKDGIMDLQMGEYLDLKSVE